MDSTTDFELFCLYDPTCAPLAFHQNRGSKELRFTCRLPTQKNKIKQLMIFAQGPCQSLRDHQVNVEIISPKHHQLLCTLSEEKKCYQWFEGSGTGHGLPNIKAVSNLKFVLVATVTKKAADNEADGDELPTEQSAAEGSLELPGSDVSGDDEQSGAAEKQEVKELLPDNSNKQMMDGKDKQHTVITSKNKSKKSCLPDGKRSKDVGDKIQLDSAENKPSEDITVESGKAVDKELFVVESGSSKDKRGNVKESKKPPPKEISKKSSKRVPDGASKGKKQVSKSKDISTYFTTSSSKPASEKAKPKPSEQTQTSQTAHKGEGKLSKDGGQQEVEKLIEDPDEKSDRGSEKACPVSKKQKVKTRNISADLEKDTIDLCEEVPEKTSESQDAVLTLLTNTPEVTKKTDGEQMQKLNENTPADPVCKSRSPFPTPKVSRKRKNDDENTPTSKPRRQKLAMKALSEKNPPLAKMSLMKFSDLTLPEDTDTATSPPKNADTSKKVSRCVDLSARVPKPSSRWGHSFTLVSSESAVLIGGQGDKQLSRDSIWSLNPETRTWKSPEVVTEGAKPEYRVGHTATYDPTMRCIYVYGGSKNAKWFHDVHIFDLDENKWTLVKANGKAPTRAYHSTSLFRHELWIFGGVFPRPDPQPDGCDNDVHIFSPVMESWYKPIVTGEKPRPRSGHSGTCIKDLMVVFGGWDFPYCYNDLYILDLTTVDWSCPKVHGAPPKPRSWHASCTLTNNRLFIHGGYDGDNALHDAHIYDLGSHSWHELALDNAPSARAGHTCLWLPSSYEDLEEDEVIVFGGGDNDGSYFSDMLSFYIPFEPKTL
ncbi:uncharacterized protein LOC101852189 [Aplysia californica]|uniref:Uncharacterized protein LOC101852189 n=1 Tax=Aplysia californica TaxID=6500 RepID=A0ABM0JUU4_APLCA|nr:uncharacterized protein LOC101852189 [Aplysia californica]